MNRHWWRLKRMAERLWVRAALFCAAAIISALIAIWIGPYIPEQLTELVGPETVTAILTILASSMLTVTTFSLSTLVSATSAAANTATPRATRLLLQDTTAQNALSTFLGAFLFSLVGLIALNTGLYGGGGRLVLFAATLILVALIVITLLRWIDHLGDLGRVSETISRVERVAKEAMEVHCNNPYMGGFERTEKPDRPTVIDHHQIGYIQNIDVPKLQKIAEEIDADFYLERRPGAYCTPNLPILYVTLRNDEAGLSHELVDDIRSAFVIGDRRSFEQDPCFGLIALSEIGSRALSPGINDPGTAIDVIETLVRVMAIRVQGCEPKEPQHDRLHVPALPEFSLFDAAFMPLSRDGAAMVEVGVRLQKALRSLELMSDDGCKATAKEFLAEARQRSLDSLPYETDKARLKTCLDRQFTM